MKTRFLVLLFVLIFQQLYAQYKGAKTLANTNENPLNTLSKTYALIIGISDYQDPAIPDLKYADKDAEAFASFLRSPAGGNLDNDHLKILINQQATMAQFAIQLDWLLQVAKENDRIIIYFSGHGDVEKKTVTQPGFLLCWDSPSQVYMSGGAFALSMLQEVITTLSTQNKSKIIVIADACRSGKLSGSSINGNQLTNANLAKQYANEIKILSCQPNEYSVEGERWGNGRGLFSYYLLQALSGSADYSKDKRISLFEIGRFLEDHVPLEASPQSQIPMIIGSKTEIISLVQEDEPGTWSNPHSDKGWGSGSKSGWELDKITYDDDYFLKSHKDDNVRNSYNRFIQRLQEKKFFEPLEDGAEYYYNLLINNNLIKYFHPLIKNKYSSVLQDDAQQIINSLLIVDLTELALEKKLKINKYKNYPHQIERAIELLGTSSLMYKRLQSMKLFFEAYILNLGNTSLDKNIGRQCIDKFNEALKLTPELPYIYMQLCMVYGRVFKMEDSTDYFGQKSIGVRPGWLLPLSNLAFIYSTTIKNPKKVKYYLTLASNIDPESSLILNYWGNYYADQKNFKKSEAYYLKVINQKADYVDPYYNLACLYSLQNKIELAFFYLEKAIVLGYDYDWINADSDLINVRNNQERWNKLIKQYYPNIK